MLDSERWNVTNSSTIVIRIVLEKFELFNFISFLFFFFLIVIGNWKLNQIESFKISLICLGDSATVEISENCFFLFMWKCVELWNFGTWDEEISLCPDNFINLSKTKGREESRKILTSRQTANSFKISQSLSFHKDFFHVDLWKTIFKHECRQLSSWDSHFINRHDANLTSAIYLHTCVHTSISSR